MDKRALFMKFLIAVIVLAVTLGVLIYIGTLIFSEEDINLQACRASVEARSTFNFGNIIEPGRDFIPLNCKTEKICISKSGKDCTNAQGFTPSGENKINKIIVKSNERTKEVALDTVSRTLRDCHWQLGQGKLNFMPSKNFAKNYCPICARIVLDEEAREEVKDTTWLEIYTRMQSRKDKDGISDLKFVYDVETVRELFPILEEVTNAIEKKHNIDNVEIGEIPAGLAYPQGTAVIAQISTPGNLFNKIGLGEGVVFVSGGVIAMVLAPVTGGFTLFAYGAIATVAGIGAGTVGAFTNTGTILGESDIALASGPILISTIPGGISYAHPTLYIYNAELLSKLQCTSFEFLPRTS